MIFDGKNDISSLKSKRNPYILKRNRRFFVPYISRALWDANIKKYNYANSGAMGRRLD